ncbi:hypothetical protein A1O1_01491 [Capronia coronata CBS 617.96]|uniref:Xylanolytic transcriptional activator regulatory domain-containing protein n=1 Tax=Capronia coronata CBS 617.96 TaxID=1182541 RepID=W9Z350_9EURO|nr:uncharacterized protein A1O1_01491 [Capronia coronata CBS 617.96]EXJ96365.1 hypothetical protein A1O1_01491 [Capronia coronata CBS 617.96]
MVRLTHVVGKDLAFPWLGFSEKCSLPRFVLQMESRLPVAEDQSWQERSDRQAPAESEDPLRAIPAHVADFLLENYISRQMPQHPIFYEPWLRSCHSAVIHHTGRDGEMISAATPYEIYTISLIMAISLSTAARAQFARVNSMAFELFNHAKTYIPEVLTNDFVGLQAIVLLYTYVMTNPAAANLYLMGSYMMQACIDLGLHYEQPDDDIDLITLDLRRRVFWTAWSVDISCSTVFRRKPTLLAKDIAAGYPSELEDGAIHSTHIDPNGRRSKIMFTGTLEFRHVTAELNSVLSNTHALPPTFGPLETWMDTMEKRIHTWATQIRQDAEANTDPRLAAQWTEMSIFCDISEPLIILTLYRPCPRINHPKTHNLIKAFYASIGVVRGYMRQTNAEFGSSKYIFHSCHHVFSAAMVFLHTLRECPSLVASMCTPTELEEYMSSFSDLFSLLAPKWPASLKCLEEYLRLLEPLKKRILNVFQHSTSRTPVDLHENNEASMFNDIDYSMMDPSHYVTSAFENCDDTILADHLPDYGSVPLDWDQYFEFQTC